MSRWLKSRHQSASSRPSFWLSTNGKGLTRWSATSAIHSSSFRAATVRNIPISRSFSPRRRNSSARANYGQRSPFSPPECQSWMGRGALHQKPLVGARSAGGLDWSVYASDEGRFRHASSKGRVWSNRERGFAQQTGSAVPGLPSKRSTRNRVTRVHPLRDKSAGSSLEAAQDQGLSWRSWLGGEARDRSRGLRLFSSCRVWVATAARSLDRLQAPMRCKPSKPSAAAAAADHVILVERSRCWGKSGGWPAELNSFDAAYMPHLESMYEDASWPADLAQLVQIASTYPTRGASSTELKLDTARCDTANQGWRPA